MGVGRCQQPGLLFLGHAWWGWGSCLGVRCPRVAIAEEQPEGFPQAEDVFSACQVGSGTVIGRLGLPLPALGHQAGAASAGSLPGLGPQGASHTCQLATPTFFLGVPGIYLESTRAGRRPFLGVEPGWSPGWQRDLVWCCSVIWL